MYRFLSQGLTNKTWKRIRHFFLVMIIVNVFGVIYASHRLRPSADDYCFGLISAQYGFIGGMIHWWNTWSGFPFSMLGLNLFVGIPLANLPLSIASAIPFLLIAFSLGLTVWAVAPRSSIQHTSRIPLFFFIAFLWWAFLWTPTSLGAILYSGNIVSREIEYLTKGLTHWQTLNGEYAFQALFLLSFWAMVWRIKKNSLLSVKLGLVLVFGLLAGVAGTALSLSFLAACILGLTFTCITKKRCLSLLLPWIFLIFGIISGMLLGHLFSPGHLLRLNLLSPNISFSVPRIVHMYSFTVPFSIKFLLQELFSSGTILVFFTSLCFSFLFSQNQIQHRTKLAKLSLAFIVFAILQVFTNRFLQNFSYIAYWHYVGSYICVFLAAYFGGAWAGQSLLCKLTNSSAIRDIFLSLLTLLILLGAGSITHMVEDIYLRESRWSSGAAPDVGITDIEEAGGWQRSCWEQLNTLRPQIYPPRKK